jgi:hypothetical protein
MNQLPPEVLILGMHRSGTSMVSGMLYRLGVNMGGDEPGRQVSNPMGHYEDGDFLLLNESILSKAGGSWESPPSAINIQNQAEAFKEKIERIVQIKEQGSRDQPWGWKDPRTSLTIDLYLPYLNNPHVIWCNRDPADIARSLWERNKIPNQESERLTKHYQKQVGDFLSRYPKIPVLTIFYQEIVNNPVLWIQKTVDFLDLKVEQEQLVKAKEFILPKDRLLREKKILWWKYILSLPFRFLRRIGKL